MKHFFDPNDVAAMESYYRKQLLEMQKKAKPMQSDTPKPAIIPPDPPHREEHTPPPSLMNPNPPSQPPNPQPNPPMPQPNPSMPQPPMPSPPPMPQLKFFERGGSDFRSGSRTGIPSAESSGILSPQPKVLRAAAMVRQGNATAYGNIKARVNTALGALPIKGAVVIIETAEQPKSLVEYLVTDGGGNTPLSKPLPTVSAKETLLPQGDPTPYTAYLVVIRAVGYETFVSESVPVFDGEVSLVEASLQPQRMNATEESNYA